MQQGEQHHADGGDPGPSVLYQESVQLRQIIQLQQSAGGEIAHEDDGNHDLVGRKSQDKGHDDDAVHADEPAERIQKLCAVGQYALAADGIVGQDPDDQPRRSCHRHRPGQHEEGAVKDGTDHHFPDLRFPIGRKLQRERGRLSPKQGLGKHPGDGKGHKDSE